MRFCAILFTLLLLAPGCAAIPDIREEAQFHNPFPQLHRVAVLPFFNQSQDPTPSGERVMLAYYNQLQTIPGFEVMPPGVVKAKLQTNRVALDETTDFQKLAQLLGVDVVVRGAITDYTPYYPPRMGIAVDWIAANPGFHPIPAGYGLPWGTAEEEFIPDSLVREAEFELAREQLKTQSPEFDSSQFPKETYPALEPIRSGPEDDGYHPEPGNTNRPSGSAPSGGPPTDPSQDDPTLKSVAYEQDQPPIPEQALANSMPVFGGPSAAPQLPPDWPDPSGFLPLPPSPERPKLTAQTRPIMTHTRMYNGNDEQFTQRLAEYFYFRDDARFGGWQAYLQRSDDFIRFCCYLHITEMLGARGGASQSRVVWRWPIGRYER